MALERSSIRALRKEDMLDLTFELINLAIDGPNLVRKPGGGPACLIVHFPPQHIVEEAFSQNKDGNAPHGPLPVRGMLAGASRLVFKLPDAEDAWPLTLETLLNWGAYQPVLAANALTFDGQAPPDPGPLPGGPTGLEIPAGLLLSPDKDGVWVHATGPVAHDGRYELWHTRLAAAMAGGGASENLPRYARAVQQTGPRIAFRNPLTKGPAAPDPAEYGRHTNEIWRLTSDFGLPKIPPLYNSSPFGRALYSLILNQRGLPQHYTPRPVNVRRLMLSALGAWANLDSAWDYPIIIAGQDDDLGYPIFGLQQWQQDMSGGRDQYVKTVETAFLCDVGHRVAIVTITRREFEPYLLRTEQTPQGPRQVLGAQAFLRQYQYLEVQEDTRDYGAVAAAYEHGGLEMPFRRIHITTRTTPFLDPLPDNAPAWPAINGQPFLFQMIVEDWEGKKTPIERPLMCVPLGMSVDNFGNPVPNTWRTVVNQFNSPANAVLRSAAFNAYPVAFAETDAGSRGKTTHKTASVTFEAQEVVGQERTQHVGSGHPLYLPIMRTADVSIPAVERLLGRPSRVQISFDNDYLQHGMDPDKNKGEVFAALTDKLDLPFASERGGGLIKPDSSIKGLSRALGPVANPAAAKTGDFDINMFSQARFLGGLTLRDILGVAKFDLGQVQAGDLDAAQLQARLDDPAFRLPVPLLTSRALDADTVETRFVWKPVIQDFPAPPASAFFAFKARRSTPAGERAAQLVLVARQITQLKGGKTSLDITGRLTDFALDFADVMRLTFASMEFKAQDGKKMDLSASGMDLQFEGALKFINTLKDILPAEGFADPPFVDVTAAGVSAGYTLGVPSIGVGIFSLQNINLSAGLSLPFVDKPAGVHFAISERHKPFLVTVGPFGGGGFFAMGLNAGGIELIEAAIEFGASISLDLGIASGGVHVMAGIYFGMTGNSVKLSGYFRCGGYLEVLGLIGISIEFYLEFTYRKKSDQAGEAYGQASVTVCVEVFCFSKSVTLTVEKHFAGAAGDPLFADVVSEPDWEDYCAAFA